MVSMLWAGLAGLIIWVMISLVVWACGYILVFGVSKVMNGLNLNLGRKLWIKECEKELPCVFLREIPHEPEYKYFVKLQDGNVERVPEYKITRKESFCKHLYERFFKCKLKTLGLDE